MMAHSLKFTKKIPPHLSRYTLKQNYSLYTPIDHASWRYIMRVSRAFFRDHAHPKYVDGLPATGISIERIPRIEEMDRRLKKMGWRAVVVSGFIPPAVFLEFLSLGILPIACDMRTLEHLAYTPAPDIVHEAAGHAPIIADPEYAKYLRHYGEIARRVIFTKEDMNVYEAIRELSEVKEDPKSTSKDVKISNKKLEKALAAVKSASEATLLSRMAWWTTEYGLVGDMEHALIYGAGLLSSVGESYSSIYGNVQRVPLTVDCVHIGYDITKPQPQLFVTPDFQTLHKILDELADQMAFRIGGMNALEKALDARTVTSTQFPTGLQVSGLLSEIHQDEGEPIYLKWKGPCQLSVADVELKGFGPNKLKDLASPVGAMVGMPHPPQVSDLQKLGFSRTKEGKILYASGIEVSGKLDFAIKNGKQLLGVGLRRVKIIRGKKIYFKGPRYILLFGTEITSVFGDAADRGSFHKYVDSARSTVGKQKTNLTKTNKKLNQLYARIRKIREAQPETKGEMLLKILQDLDRLQPDDWLSRLEVLELVKDDPQFSTMAEQLKSKLEQIGEEKKDVKALVHRGLELMSLSGPME